MNTKNEWRCRLLKAKYLLAEVSKTERAVKNHQILETLCAAIALCAETEKQAGDGKSDTGTAFKEYFLGKLRAHIAKLHGTSLLAKYPENAEPYSGFTQSLEFVLGNFPEQFDSPFQVRCLYVSSTRCSIVLISATLRQLWLIEISCHASATSFYFESGRDAKTRIEVAKQYFRHLSERTSVSREMHVYHLVISGFYYLRYRE